MGSQNENELQLDKEKSIAVKRWAAEMTCYPF